MRGHWENSAESFGRCEAESAPSHRFFARVAPLELLDELFHGESL